MQALHLQHRSPSSYRVKASASYVDETLFGSPTGTRPTLPDFDPPWVQSRNRSRGAGPGPPKVSPTKKVCESPSSRGSTPNLTPRKKNKYRLIGHTPSYCDESLFGTSRQGSRTAVEDAAKLRTLFWTPPATPRGSHSPRPRETPLRAVHPAGPSGTEPGVATGSRKVSQDGLGVPRPLGQRRSHSLTHLTVPSTGHPMLPRPTGLGVPSLPHQGRLSRVPWSLPRYAQAVSQGQPPLGGGPVPASQSLLGNEIVTRNAFGSKLGLELR